jgi:hypothetical protein
MGRSFRVGWSIDGKIVYPSKLQLSKMNSNSLHLCHEISVERIDTLKWVHNSYSSNLEQSKLLDSSLEAILASSHKEIPTLKSILSPQWITPKSDNLNEIHEYVPFLHMLHSLINIFQEQKIPYSHPDWTVQKALELINAAYGQEIFYQTDLSREFSRMIPLFEKRIDYSIEQWEQRRTAFSLWISSVCRPEG